MECVALPAVRLCLIVAVLALSGCGRLGFTSNADGSDADMDAFVMLPDGRIVPTDGGPTDGGPIDGRVSDAVVVTDGATEDGGFVTTTLVCGSPLAASALALGLAEAWCVAFLDHAEPFVEFFLFGDLANCTDILQTVILSPEFGVTALLDAIEAGTVLYDASDASSCLCATDEILVFDDNGPLAPLMGGGGACRSALQGTVALGGACTLDFECLSDGICVEGGACGICTARTPIGGSCTSTSECARGADFGALCDAGRCVEARFVDVPSGGTCDVPDVVGDVATIGSCPAGELCSFEDEVCVTPPGPGEPCTTVCATGYFCAPDVCTAIEVSRRVGDPCDDMLSGDPIRICDMFAGLECGPAGTCECPAGSCTRSGAIGEACSEIFQCEPGAYCDGAVCAARLGAGATCTSPEQCRSGACETGSCATTFCGPLAFPGGGP